MKNSVLLPVLLLLIFSINSNSQWHQTSTGMFDGTITSIAVSGNDVFAGGGGKGIFISNNNGIDWHQSSLMTGSIRAIFNHSNKIFAGASSGIYTSQDNGLSWSFISIPSENFCTFAVKGNKLFAGAQKNALNGDLYFSTDNGASFQLSTLTGKNVYSLSVTSSRIYASTSQGLFYSDDDGISWNIINFNYGIARVVAADDSGVIVLTTGIGVTRSTDNGLSWNPLPFQQGNDYGCIIFDGTNVYIGANNNQGVYVSTNKGSSWTGTSLNRFVSAIALSGNTLFAGGDVTGLYKTTNNGVTWSQPELCIQDVHALVSSGNTLIAGINSAVNYTTNNGASWNGTSFNAQQPSVFSLAANGLGNVYAGTQDYGIVTSQSNGTSFEYNHPSIGGPVYSIAAFENLVFAGSTGGVYVSQNNGTSFTQTSLSNRVIRALIYNSSILFAGTESNGIYVSTNNGAAWVQSPLNNVTVMALSVTGNKIIAGTLANGVFISSDNGASWVQTSLNNRDIFSLAVSGNNIFAGSDRNSGIYVSNDNGNTWIQRNEGWSNVQVSSLCIFNNFIYAGTISSGVFKRSLDELTAIQPISNTMPNEFSLSQNYPNPFNPSTKIKFSIPHSSSVAQTFLSVYDILGKEVTALVNERLTPGTYEVEWNASNYPTGIYFYRLSSSEFTQTNKMVLIK